MSAFDDLWNLYLNCVTADKMVLDRKKPMTRECAVQIVVAEERWGKGTMRPELLAEARLALLNKDCDDYALIDREEIEAK